jgi:hypothetical protein
MPCFLYSQHTGLLYDTGYGMLYTVIKGRVKSETSSDVLTYPEAEFMNVQFRLDF